MNEKRSSGFRAGFESGALPSCCERTPPDHPAAQLALLFVLCSTPDVQLLRFQSGQIGFDGAQIVFGDLKAGQFRVIALDKPELGASILQTALWLCARMAQEKSVQGMIFLDLPRKR